MSLLPLLIVLLFASTTYGFCGSSIRWAHNFNMDDVFGIWYGVGYAQHTPDLTNKPNDVGCVTLYITDPSNEGREDYLSDWSIKRRNYSGEDWRSYKSNPWSGTHMSGSWLDVKLNRRKRDMYNEKRIKIIWDEDGQTMEQTYFYTTETPGLWVAEKRRPLEQELMARGIDVYYPDDPPRHPEVIRVIKVTPHMMIINHCSDSGDRGIFSLILRRSPARVERWEWYDLQRQFFNFELPNMHRYMAICDACYLTGEAEQLIRHIPITNTNYDQCWEKLEKRYNNKKMLVNGILQRLFRQNMMLTESGEALKQLLDTTCDCLSALKNLDIDVSTWDVLIIHIVAEKLDPETRKQWELSVFSVNANQLPTFEELQNFIENRYRALEYQPLADPELNRPGKVDMILGADIYSKIIEYGLKKNSEGNLIAQNTVFGWLISGVVNCT
ncbi:uncharacterized protein LOC106136901 [Amyelois transitella]|uniref:uncharacterized protein LOC106136901 n=1 Tax=Amyelois transitella TaxID=680683 RepID=UPI00298F549E|nr:uncharacterized protein LOC106136901 [Amyelois transitella]